MVTCIDTEVIVELINKASKQAYGAWQNTCTTRLWNYMPGIPVGPGKSGTSEQADIK